MINSLSQYNLPILITENGINDGKDRVRSKFILEHLKEIHKLIQNGVPIKGYFHWTLADNFEWREGFSAKFGLATKERKLKKSGRVYAQICQSSEIDC